MNEQPMTKLEQAKWLVDMYTHLDNGGEMLRTDIYSNSPYLAYEPDMNSDPDEWFKKPILVTRTISYPKAETEQPKVGTEYFIPCVGRSDMFIRYVWEDIFINSYHFSEKLVHLIRDNAIQHTMSLLGRKNETNT